ncbi:MAG: hypothetical protein OER91_04715 [Gammaproteobacteria bacterium]|nr:hypothetical protein [Gammaproteobacteria bacterium]
MTLLVDRRKDNYDDLLMLARDARVSRARVNRWTTGLVVGAMAAMGVYVATVSKEVDQLRDTAKDAVEQRDTIRDEYARLMAERNSLKAQKDIFARYEEMYADIAPAVILGDRFKDIAVNGSGSPSDDDNNSRIDRQVSMSNLVWIVDGSRRFPMTSGDILWIPEGQFWVRMEKPRSGRKPDTVTIHQGKKPVASSTGTRHQFEAVAQGETDQSQVDKNVHRIPVGETRAVRRGVADCIKLTYHDKSSRFGFEGEEWVDIEVLFYNNAKCPKPQATPDESEPD